MQIQTHFNASSAPSVFNQLSGLVGKLTQTPEETKPTVAETIAVLEQLNIKSAPRRRKSRAPHSQRLTRMDRLVLQLRFDELVATGSYTKADILKRIWAPYKDRVSLSTVGLLCRRLVAYADEVAVATPESLQEARRIIETHLQLETEAALVEKVESVVISEPEINPVSLDQHIEELELNQEPEQSVQLQPEEPKVEEFVQVSATEIEEDVAQVKMTLAQVFQTIPRVRVPVKYTDY